MLPEQVDALALTVGVLFNAVQAAVADQLPQRRWHQLQAETAIRAWATKLPADVPIEVAVATKAGLRWLDMASPSLAAAADGLAVFGQVDGNLANFLWDGDRVRVVDFEDSGRSDRAYELADITEHVAAWVDTDFYATGFRLGLPTGRPNACWLSSLSTEATG